ncbi:hypothetical protein C1M51_05220 [Methylibium sp. Pch-M]|uniref:DUF3047 domain-containing protein n=1 Tax=Methylibium sp. Pch-M TaxID=2082386 RepID=UPI0010116B76|nr:DUF3047 domain-containing protein [Methylibium sp. Pch-M]QAZ38881.1 hypothetical protein C1M51_05220 [Methylibium sp. Pch-M]
MRRLALGVLCVLGACAQVPNRDPLILQAPTGAPWSPHCVPAWQPHALPGKRGTRYDLGTDAGQAVVRARADASASMLRYRVRLEPDALQTLRFSWRVNALIDQADVRRRESEDSPARIVLAFDGDHGALPLKDRSLFELAELVTGERPPFATLMYVWDNGAPLESVVINPRSDRVRKIVVESGPAHLRQWREHERDISADYRRAFGEAPGALIGIGLMTDADNTGTSATAWYGAVCLSGVPLSSTPN